MKNVEPKMHLAVILSSYKLTYVLSCNIGTRVVSSRDISGALNKIRCAPSKYAPEEIKNSMFLPLIKKAFMGGIGGRHQI